MNFDLNQGIKDPDQKKFVRPILLIAFFVTIVIIGFLSFNGKHNKIGKDGIETNIPTDTSKPVINSIDDHSTHDDHSIHINRTENYNPKEESTAILKISKYIDTNKTIYINWGSNTSSTDLKSLKEGFYPFKYLAGIPILDPTDSFNIKLDKGQLLVNFVVYGFDDKYVGKVVNNKLITPNKNLEIYKSDHYFEIIDEYNVPALQIDLDKKNNSINLGGAFSGRYSYIVIGPDGATASSFGGQDKRNLADSTYKWFFSMFLDAGRKLKPLHEH